MNTKPQRLKLFFHCRIQKLAIGLAFLFNSIPTHAWLINFTYSGSDFSTIAECARNPLLSCTTNAYSPTDGAHKAINGVFTISGISAGMTGGWSPNVTHYRFSDGFKTFTPDNSVLDIDASVFKIDYGYNITSWNIYITEYGNVPFDLLSPGQSTKDYMINISGRVYPWNDLPSYTYDSAISATYLKGIYGIADEQRTYYYTYDSSTRANQNRWQNDTKKIFLDFGGAFTKDFKVKNKAWESGQFIEIIRGSHSTYNFDLADQKHITEQVQKIFFDSGIPITVTSQKPTQGDFITVNFGTALPAYDSDGDGKPDATLGGLAYDVMSTYFGTSDGVDRYDTRKDGNVAVFVDGTWGSDPIAKQHTLDQIAKSAAHESGHAMGTRHINSFIGTAEVMDYDDSGFTNGTPLFTQYPVNIIELPYDNGGVALSDTHNPAYHIRRYAIGEDPDSLLFQEGLAPGSWDMPNIPNPYLRFLIDIWGDSLVSLSVITSDAYSGLLGEGPIASELIGFDSKNGVLEAYFPSGSYLEFVGSTNGNDDWNVAIVFGRFGWQPVSVEDLAAGEQASVLKYDNNSKMFSRIGTMSVIATTAPVPEPTVYMMLFLGLGLIFSYRAISGNSSAIGVSDIGDQRNR